MILQAWTRLCFWWHRRGIKGKSTRFVYDAFANAEIEYQRRIRTEPKIERFLPIPNSGPFTEGLSFDEPPETLSWFSSHEEYKTKILKGKEWCQAEVRFLGFPFHFVTVNFDGVYLPPHRGGCISNIHLSGPFRKVEQMTEEFNQCHLTLLKLLGPPTFEEEVDFFLWPKHTRRKWDLGFLVCSHSISDIKDSDPVNKLLIRRKYVPELEAKWSHPEW